jgi:hypothetical protein
MDGMGAQNAASATLPREGVSVGSMAVLEETSYPNGIKIPACIVPMNLLLRLHYLGPNFL